MIPVVRENIIVKLALAIPTAALIAVINETIDIPPVVALKIIKILSMQSKTVTYLFNFLLYDFLLINLIDKIIINLFYFI